MLLNAVLSKYYTQVELNAAIIQLKSFGLYDDLQASAQEFYCLPPNIPKRGGSPYAKLMIRYIQLTLKCLEPLPRDKTMEATVNKLLNVLAALMVDAMLFSGISPACFLRILQKATQSHLKDLNQDTWKYYCILEIATKKVAEDAAYLLSESSGLKTNKCTTLLWEMMTNDCKNKITVVDFANDVLELFSGLKSLSAILALMDATLAPLPVRIPRRHLEAFLVLFALLHKCGRISCSPDRGLFQFLKERMVKAGKENLPKRSDYRKIKSEALSDPQTNQTLRTLLQPIFEKYCQGLKYQIIFFDYFDSKLPQTRECAKASGR